MQLLSLVTALMPSLAVPFAQAWRLTKPFTWGRFLLVTAVLATIVLLGGKIAGTFGACQSGIRVH